MQSPTIATNRNDRISLINTTLTVYKFQEENIYYAYLPAMAITGYGYTNEEAWASLQITLTEFLKYTMENDTLIPELQQLGWILNKETDSFIPPSDTEMYHSNEQLQEITDKIVYTTVSITVQLPIL